jgi:hypothetical protein
MYYHSRLVLFFLLPDQSQLSKKRRKERKERGREAGREGERKEGSKEGRPLTSCHDSKST